MKLDAQITIRLPQALKDALEQEAGAQQHSTNWLIVKLLSHAMNLPTEPKPRNQKRD